MSKAILSATITLAVGSLFIAGCATKNYVKQSITPVDQKIDQVDKSSQTRDSSQVADINKTNQVVDEDEKKLSATDEIAKTADGTSKGAMAKANQNTKDMGDLRNVIANIDDYKPAGQTVVHFAINKDTLTKDEKAKLDEVATQLGSQARYFITVEGFTDQTGERGLQRPVEPCARQSGDFLPGGQPRCSRLPDPYGRTRGSEADRRRQGQESA